MSIVYYVGLDVHKKMIAFCVKTADGRIVEEGVVAANRAALGSWAGRLPTPWKGVMEATIFSHWIYYFLKPFALELLMGNPARMKAISAGKKKNDKLDARTLTDLLRCNMVPACWVPPPELENLRRCLRFRGLLVGKRAAFQNRMAGCLMEVGIEYEAKKLRGKRYFHQLLRTQPMSGETKWLLEFGRRQVETLKAADQLALDELESHPLLRERVARLQEIGGVGQVTALTWVLEIGDPRRFTSIKKACSYCGLTTAERSSAGKVRRGPISKQRNPHLQHVLVEAAKLAPQWNENLQQLHDKECERGHKNTATLSVARKLVAYMLAVDRRTVARLAATPPPAEIPAAVLVS